MGLHEVVTSKIATENLLKLRQNEKKVEQTSLAFPRKSLRLENYL
jgi:hypothetical protein